jgi:hypothetical protein
MFKPTTLFASAIIAASLAVNAAALPASAQSTTQSGAQSTAQSGKQASVQSTTGQACFKIRVTARTRVAIREFQFVNADVLRTVPRGTTLTACKFVQGGGATSYFKCGAQGVNWFQVRSGVRTAFLNSPFGYVPVSCATVVL